MNIKIKYKIQISLHAYDVIVLSEKAINSSSLFLAELSIAVFFKLF